MQSLIQIEVADRRLLESIGEIMAEAARRSGTWLACRPGCTPCCMGPFGITELDAIRLRAGLAALGAAEPTRAAAVRQRAAAYVAAIAPLFPGDPASGALRDEEALPSSMEDVACPALDPDTGLCDLYDSRPITCRTFGPATRIGENTLGACELCYEGATDEQMAACSVETDPQGLEAEALAVLGPHPITIVAYTLVSPVVKK